jgi:membrane protein DedA with SNARE-associated domain
MIIAAHDTMNHLVAQYGSFALFGLLAFGIIGLPVPDETLLLVTGFMAAKGELSLTAILIAAILGSCLGITVSYLIGRFLGGKPILFFGKYIGITESKLKKAHDWFEKLGKYLLFVGYFIPGLRHFTGLCAGTTKLDYKTFAFFAYAGATVWAIIFTLTGYFFFNQWQHWHF